jgi:hypothetical protein
VVEDVEGSAGLANAPDDDANGEDGIRPEEPVAIVRVKVSFHILDGLEVRPGYSGRTVSGDKKSAHGRIRVSGFLAWARFYKGAR